MLCVDYLHDIINHPSWPGAIAFAAGAAAVAAIVWAFIYLFGRLIH